VKQSLWLAAEFLYLYAPLLLSAAISGLVMRQDWLAFARRPIDAGRSLHGKRLFGDSKTWRGVLVAVVGCIVGATIQKYAIGDHARSFARLDYTRLDVLLFGATMGVTAMLGELPNSFVKRRLNIAPGHTTQGWLAAVFYVWDQVDLLMFSLPALACWARIDAELIASAFAVTLILHPTVSLIGYVIGARRTAR
jgi:hypothetical protein